ncbi:hypothetical protein KBD59_01220 [Candidatus Gracilibacteria bacterium]|nr:hypothetical protein [Candidatus Gracilibacteria bacterium]
MNKKNLFIVAGLLLSLALLSGCKSLSDARTKAQDTINGVVVTASETVEGVKDQVNKTTESVKKKVDDVNNAVKQVNEAVDAVKNVGE